MASFACNKLITACNFFSKCTKRHWELVGEQDCRGICWSSGDSHYKTFDDKTYTHVGACAYDMLKAENFSVVVENVPCTYSAVTCYKSITVTYHSMQILIIDHDTVLFNGDFIDISASGEVLLTGGISYSKAGFFSTLHIESLGLSVMFDGGWQIVHLVEHWLLKFHQLLQAMYHWNLPFRRAIIFVVLCGT